MKIRIVYILLIFLAAVGCKKQKDKNIQPSKDFALMSNGITSIVPLLNNIGLTDDVLRSAISIGSDSINTCADILFISGDTLNVSESSPLIFDVDFSSGCVDRDNIYKKGKIRCSLLGYMSNSGASYTCSFVGFEVGGNSLTGSVVVTNTGNFSFLITTSNLRLKVGKKYIYLNTEMQMNQLGGIKTETSLIDNSYSVSLNSILTDRYGKEFDVFTEELFKKYSCKWLTGGFAELNDEENNVQVIDFGDNNCDNEAVISIDEKVYSIDMQ